jgi:hypothetical protein
MSTYFEKEGPHQHQSDLIDNFDLLLGRSIRHFQLVEYGLAWRVLQLAVASSIPNGEVADILKMTIGEMSFGAKLKFLETLLKYKIPKRKEYRLSNERVKIDHEIKCALNSIKRLYKLEESRNIFVHSNWLVLHQPPDVNELIDIYRFKSKRNGNDFEAFPLKAFSKFLNEVIDADKEMGESTGRLLGLLDYDEDKKQLMS